MTRVIPATALLALACGSSGSPSPASAQGGSTAENGGTSAAFAGNGAGGIVPGAAANRGTAGTDSSSAGLSTSGAGDTGNGAGSAESEGTAGGAAGGAPPVITPVADRVRTVLPFDDEWLFVKGDATGADQSAFADTAWRALSVPHDWSIEGPFDQNAATLGNGGYLPAGIGWYRKHFTLPASLSASRVFVEFDGVMSNSDVYINGFHLGNRPNGYVSFRYELTGHATFGSASNVISVRVNNSAQPASRWFAGAGINRHVRVVAMNPVHVDQWATFVTTPTVSAASATVHLTTSIVNQGSAAQSVSLQAVVSDPSGSKLAPVAAPAQMIAAGASGTFAFDVPVSNPKLWSPAGPSLYQVLVSVLVGGAAVDDDLVPFGIRTIKIDPATGMTLNGAPLKFKGAALHPDVSGLGTAVPMRAWQRRIAQLKALGANAIRTAHDPFPPEFYDLCDRMGMLVMDEMFDAWTAHKLAGDYGGATFNTWGNIDLTDTLKRDRNHPSVAIYSIGNEIRDSLASRATTAMKLVATCHTVDPTRPVTQALFRPLDNGDVMGATRNILDVFGGNYRLDEVIQATTLTPIHAGLGTEMGLEADEWNTINKTPAMIGDFLWSGFDYLGEAANMWPTVGSVTGLMDRMGTFKGDAYTFNGLWSSTPVARPATGTSASKLVVSADHAAITTDGNDLAYVKVTVADASGKVVTSAGNAVTFAITGPGSIIAVDSGSVAAESFRGMQRKAYQGVCFAIVRATGAGAIGVSASAAGLTGGTAMIQASAGRFVPCSGSCD